MSIVLHATMPKWAPLRDPIDLAFVLRNEGSEGVFVNRRCACGPPSSGADIAVEVHDVHGRRISAKRASIPPPSAADFVWLDPGKSAYGTSAYDLLWDHELPVGKYVIQLLYRKVDTVPKELEGKPTFTGMIRPDNKRVDVIPWGATPPGYDSKSTSEG